MSLLVIQQCHHWAAELFGGLGDCVYSIFPEFVISAMSLLTLVAFSALTLLVGRQEDRKGIWPVKKQSAGVVVCLEWGPDLHMAQLMPLPLIVSCFSASVGGWVGVCVCVLLTLALLLDSSVAVLTAFELWSHSYVIELLFAISYCCSVCFSNLIESFTKLQKPKQRFTAFHRRCCFDSLIL